MLTKDLIFSLISEEKEKFAEYSRLCAHYQIQADTIALAKHQAKIELLNFLLKESGSLKS
jgi:hypothetical protein